MAPFSANLVPFPVAAFRFPFPEEAAVGSVPGTKTNIRCRMNPDPMLDRTARRCRAEGGAASELASGHSPMVTMPEALADLLISIAGARRAG